MMRDEMCCKSVGTDLSMLDIEDFITEISQLKKEVALLEAKLGSRGDEEVNREDVDCCESSVFVTDGSSTECLDQSSPQLLLDKLSEEKSRHVQGSKLSLTLLCYTESKPTDTQDTAVCDSNQGLKDEESSDQTSTESLDSACNPGEQMCSVKLMDCRDLKMEIKTEAMEEEDHTVENEDFILPEVALLEAKPRSRGDEGLKREDVVRYVTDGGSTECHMYSVWIGSRDQSTPQLDKLFVEKSIHTKDSELSLKLQDEESSNQTSTESLDSACNAGEQQQILQTTLKMCSVKLVDCRNLKMEIKTEHIKEEDDTAEDEEFILSDEKSDSCSDGETSLTSKERLTARTQEKKLHSEEHREKKKKKKKKFHCEHCGKNFLYSSQLKCHMRTHSDEKPFCCTECGNYFRTKYSLDVHKRIHTGEKAYKYSKSGKTRDSGLLKSHQNIHSKEKPYQCSHCDKRFHLKSYLIRHEIIHTGEKPYHCSVCGKSFIQRHHLESHQRTHTGEKPYKCSQCEKTFALSDSLKAHQRHHTGEKPYVCSQCGKSFFARPPFKVHLRIHTGEKPFVCSHCGKSFSDRSHFRVHLRIHTGEKPYNCNVCGKSFSRKDTLVKHQTIHTGERLYKCSQCNKTFSRPDVLRNHQRVHTGEKPYYCTVCGKSFNQNSQLVTHQITHTKKDVKMLSA